MKTKDQDWYEGKVEEIRKKKRKLRHIQDTKKVKQIKGELKREQRAAKRSLKQHLKKWINEQIE
jgi:hypothetical protein